MAIRLVIVDDHTLIRQGLTSALQRDGSIEVVGEAASVAAAERLVDSLSPDVVLVDVSLPDGNGLDFAKALRARRTEVGIVVLTMHGDDQHLFRALDAGASAFVLKSAPSEEVIAAVQHAAVAPNSFTATDLASAMRRRMDGDRLKLTRREAEVLELLKDGLSVSAAARRMYISESTAKTHIARLYDKLGATNRTQAIMEALRLGLISQGPGNGQRR